MLDKMQAPPVPKEPAQTNPQQDEPLRVRSRIIPIEEDSELSDSDAKEGEYRRRTHQRGRHYYGPKTPLSEELEEI